jgi:RNA polymerase primary sigma factor
MTVMNLMLKEIGQTKTLNKKQERALFTEYNLTSNQRRRNEIKSIIVNSNMRFVLRLALKYKNMVGVDIKDLVSEGKLGLLIAFDKFNISRDLKFFSYAVCWIRCKMGKYLEENDLIKLPSNQKVKLNKARVTKEVKDFDKNLRYLNEISNIHTSIDSSVNGNEDLHLSEIIKDEKAENLETSHIKKKLKDELIKSFSKELTSEEMIVITNLYGIKTGDPLPLRNVRDIIGKSHERVRQIRDNAIRTLRKSPDVKKFREFFYVINSDA